MTESVQPIEGITPTMLWNAVIVLLGLCAAVVLVYKVIEIGRKEHKRKVEQRELGGKDLTDQIADKVILKLSPKLDEINKKLNNDKQRLDGHERRLNQDEDDLGRIGENTEKILDAMDGLLLHFITGNDVENLKKVKQELDHYKNSKVST